MESRVSCVVPLKPPTFSESVMVELRKDDIARGYYGKRKEAFLKWLEQPSEAPTKRQRKRQKTHLIPE